MSSAGEIGYGRPLEHFLLTPDPIHPDRIQPLSSPPERDGAYVLYWMQQSQRAEWNHALEYAIQQANERRLPVVVGFGLTDGYPEANLRHYRFLLEGLQETAAALRERGLGFVLRLGSPERVALELAREAALLVCDVGYLRHQRQWRETVAREATCPVDQVEADLVVPVQVASQKAEWGARTLRPKIGRCAPEFLEPLPPVTVRRDASGSVPDGESLEDLEALLDRLRLDRTVAPVSQLYRGGTREANRRLQSTVDHLHGYAADRSRPELDHVSHLSKYLQFGQISPVKIALAIREARAGGEEDQASFLEELLVRRELAHNWVYYTPDYDRFSSLPPWARATLAKHAGDPRPHCYEEEELDQAETHDPYWNAAMRELRQTGSMHNLLRMYWGKKLLEWSPSPEEGFRRTLRWNNRYFLDGRNPNSFTNVAWIYGLHDRPWGERPIYGTIRCMVASGLERKCDIREYARRWASDRQA